MAAMTQSPAQREAAERFFDLLKKTFRHDELTVAKPVKLTAVIEGRDAIRSAAQQLLSREVSAQSEPILCVSLSTPSLLEPDFLPEIIDACAFRRGKRLRVRHVAEIPAESRLEDATAWELLRPIALIAALFCDDRLDYEPYILSTDSFSWKRAGVLYPNYLIFSNRALLISSDGETAMYLSSEVMAHTYRAAFDRKLCISECARINFRSASDALVMFGTDANDDDREIRRYSFTHTPILHPQYTAEFFEKQLRPDLPDREKMLENCLGQMENWQKRHLDFVQTAFFTEDGLMRFCEDGVSSELPRSVFLPVPQADRPALLPDQRKLRNIAYQMVDEERFFLPRPLSLYLSESSMLLVLDQQKGEPSTILLRDARVLEIFCGFFADLAQSDAIVSKMNQRTLWAKARKKASFGLPPKKAE